MAEHSGPRQHFGNPLFREVHKNTWLKRIYSNDSKKKKEKIWVVFCVHDDTEPFLESYVDNKLAVVHKPEWFISLSDTKHISPTICPHEQEYEFVITLSSEVIRLAASSWELMLDWVETLKGKLLELRILTPKENLYTKLPENRGPLLPTRDPTSPLPPPPAIPPAILPGVEQLPQTSVEPIPMIRSHPILQRGLSLPESTSHSSGIQSGSSDNITIIEVESRSAHQNSVFNFDVVSSALVSTASGAALDERNEYERLFESPGPSTRVCQIQRSSSSPRRLQPPPQPHITLRERQVYQLQKEMKHPGGVRLQLRRKDCHSSIAFVDAFASVWIAGWKQKEHPMLYNALHIGDQLLSIEGITVKSANDAHKVLRSTCYGLYVNMVIKRVPYGQVFVIHREFDGQSLGIIQEGNTAVIHTIEEDSLAAQHGLSAKTKTCDGLSFTNWVLTEINGRPLNLFFKESQVRDRLHSVGRDISILVQPLDLIKQLKKQLKSIRNYKDYILQ